MATKFTPASLRALSTCSPFPGLLGTTTEEYSSFAISNPLVYRTLPSVARQLLALLCVSKRLGVGVGAAAIRATASLTARARGGRPGLDGTGVQADIDEAVLFYHRLARGLFEVECPPVHREIRAQPAVQQARAHIEHPLHRSEERRVGK